MKRPLHSNGAAWFAALVALTGAGVVVALALPALFGAALDAATGRAPDPRALPAFAVASAALVAVTVLAQITEANGVTNVIARLRVRLIGHVLAVGAADVRHVGSGDLVSRVVGVAPRAASLGPLVVDALAALTISCGAVFALWRIAWELVATLALAAPCGALMARAFARDTARLTSRYLELHGRLASRLVDALGGLRTIRASRTVDREIERVLAPLPELGATGRDLWRAAGRNSSRAAVVGPLASLVTLAVAGRGVATGDLTPGELVAATGYIPMALGLLGGVELVAQVAAIRVASRRCGEILSIPVPPTGRRQLPRGPGRLRVSGVTVTAGDTTVLDSVDLTVAPGTLLAIVGRSGCGKSTLAAVAGGLVEPTAGRVVLDDVPLAELDSGDLRDAVAYAFERPALLGTSIRDVITYGRERIPGERVVAAAREAQIDVFVDRLPAGYDTALDQAPMSGGERQRLGLARAFVRRPRLLILDDATSSLDTLTEAQVRLAMTRTFAGTTRLVVAHRMATAATADRVAWLDAGRLRAVAAHGELWAHPDYRAVFDQTEVEMPVEVFDAAPA